MLKAPASSFKATIRRPPATSISPRWPSSSGPRARRCGADVSPTSNRTSTPSRAASRDGRSATLERAATAVGSTPSAAGTGGNSAGASTASSADSGALAPARTSMISSGPNRGRDSHRRRRARVRRQPLRGRGGDRRQRRPGFSAPRSRPTRRGARLPDGYLVAGRRLRAGIPLVRRPRLAADRLRDQDAPIRSRRRHVRGDRDGGLRALGGHGGRGRRLPFLTAGFPLLRHDRIAAPALRSAWHRLSSAVRARMRTRIGSIGPCAFFKQESLRMSAVAQNPRFPHRSKLVVPGTF